MHAGATDGLRILIGVDLVLGPLLTFIVFNTEKKSLPIDLTIIGMIQAACLCVGLWLVYNERPIAQLLADDGIHLMTQSEFELYKETLPSKISKIRPNAYILELPDDWSQIPSIKYGSALADNKPFSFRTDLYRSFSKIKLLDFKTRVANIIQHLPEHKLEELELLEKTESCDWVPVISKHVKGAACVNLIEGIIKLSEHNKIFPI